MISNDGKYRNQWLFNIKSHEYFFLIHFFLKRFLKKKKKIHYYVAILDIKFNLKIFSNIVRSKPS